jgi:hypothetical protein
MRVDMYDAVAMAVLVKMHAVPPQPPQHMSAETDQHDADRRLERSRQIFGNGVAEHQRSTSEHEQRQGVAEPPGQAMLDDIADMGAARGDAGDRRDMIGLERVLHAQQKPEPQNSKHILPALAGYRRKIGGVAAN